MCARCSVKIESKLFIALKYEIVPLGPHLFESDLFEIQSNDVSSLRYVNQNAARDEGIIRPLPPPYQKCSIVVLIQLL